MRDVSERLRDIQEVIRQITKYTNLGRQSFDQNELVRIWVIHHLEIIGEALVLFRKNSKIVIQKYLGDKSVECGMS